MEEVKAPEYRSSHRGYNRTSANCVEVDSEWDSNEVRQERPGRGSDRPGESFLFNHT